MQSSSTYDVWTAAAWDHKARRAGWGCHISAIDSAPHESFGPVAARPRPCPQRAHLTAILMALQALPDGASAVVRTSNEYAFKGITVWSTKWRESSFRLSAEGKPLKDSDLWLAIERQRMRLSVVFQHTPNFLENSASPGAARGLAQALAAMEAKRIAKTLLKERAAATTATSSKQP